MGKRILIVDDDKEFSEELSDSLKANGYETAAINAPSGFLSAIRRVKPDLILLDYKMPVRSGFELLVSRESFPELCNIPVVVMSAHLLDDQSSLFDMFHVQGCFRKPFDMQKFISLIDDVCCRTRG